jgi:hypothetical protein
MCICFVDKFTLILIQVISSYYYPKQIGSILSQLQMKDYSDVNNVVHFFLN